MIAHICNRKYPISLSLKPCKYYITRGIHTVVGITSDNVSVKLCFNSLQLCFQTRLQIQNSSCPSDSTFQRFSLHRSIEDLSFWKVIEAE